ncbi:MAG TPA: helix-turn-helix domain-containing protein [Planctomycetota bacterium]|nr:helix-turn-helix domain-containing protein [Planctomycetota bacterium]
MPEEMIGFEEAMRRLQLSEEELQNLVTSGTLRAFRAGGEMKFKVADLDGLKKERETEPTIIIPAAGGPAGGEIKVEMPDDLVVDESAQTVVGGGEAATPTVAIPEQGTEELVFDDKELEVLPLEEEAAGTQAAGEAATVVEEASAPGEITVAEDGAVEAAPKKSASGRRPLSSRAASISRRRSAAFEVRKGSPIMTIVLGLTAAGCIFTLSVFGVIVAKGYRAGTAPADQMYVPGYLESAYQKMSGWGEK